MKSLEAITQKKEKRQEKTRIQFIMDDDQRTHSSTKTRKNRNPQPK